ncbi:hypothetical protein LINGRAHAP2_LOCUS2051 [Linum grandiflorum]
MMGYPSIEEKCRIMGIWCWHFDSFRILADDWIPDGDRSNVLACNCFCWIYVYTSPLHLQSAELFKAIGDMCGSFIETDITNWFRDGLRIKV